MRRLQFGIAATQSLGLPQTAERRCRGLGAFFWLLGSAGSGNTYSLWDHQNRADPGLGLVVADTANVPSRPQNMVVAAFLEKDLFFNGLLGLLTSPRRRLASPTGQPVYGRACPGPGLPKPRSAITTRPIHLLPRQDFHLLACQRSKAALRRFI